MMLGRKPRKITCHPDRKHFARGWCSKCYYQHVGKQQERALRVSVALGRVDYKRPGFVEEAINTWEDKLNDPGTVANIVGAAFGVSAKDATTDEYGA